MVNQICLLLYQKGFNRHSAPWHLPKRGKSHPINFIFPSSPAKPNKMEDLLYLTGKIHWDYVCSWKLQERSMSKEESPAQGWYVARTHKNNHMGCQNTEVFPYQLLLPWYFHLLNSPHYFGCHGLRKFCWYHHGHQTMPSCCSTKYVCWGFCTPASFSWCPGTPTWEYHYDLYQDALETVVQHLAPS